MGEQDAISLLVSDHRTVEGLFEQYERAGAGDTERRREIVDHIVRELSIHASVEEQYLYPFVREEVQGGERLAEQGLGEHREAEEILADLDGMDPDDPRFDALVRAVVADVRHHVEEEERELFPALRRAASEERLAELGRTMAEVKAVAPTHPHPRSPKTAPLNKVGDRAAGLVDRVRDAAAGRDEASGNGRDD